jgi:hypothetical protein
MNPFSLKICPTGPETLYMETLPRIDLVKPERNSRKCIMLGGGKSMWLQPSPWLDTTAPCLADERGGENG